MVLTPWCIFGDFNDLSLNDEKIGLHDHPNWLIQSFHEAIFDFNLHDLPMEGYKFTWAKRKGKFNVVEEKLDRALATFD